MYFLFCLTILPLICTFMRELVIIIFSPTHSSKNISQYNFFESVQSFQFFKCWVNSLQTKTSCYLFDIFVFGTNNTRLGYKLLSKREVVKGRIIFFWIKNYPIFLVYDVLLLLLFEDFFKNQNAVRCFSLVTCTNVLKIGVKLFCPPE